MRAFNGIAEKIACHRQDSNNPKIMDSPTIEAGVFVRLVHDPARMGITTGENRPNGAWPLIGVRFPNGVQFVPRDQLEFVPAEIESPVTMLGSGRLVEPARLRQVLTHIRLTGRLADLIYSMEATNTDFHAYQFKPVLKMLTAPLGGLLIADEVGLGKTIEAGLIWTELRARFDLRRLLVLCPKTLRDKWRRELRTKFAVEASYYSAAELLELLDDPDRMSAGFAAICSMQSIRPPKGWNDDDAPKKKSARAKLANFLTASADEPLIDMLVIDEAHHLRNPETFLHQLGQLVRTVSSHVVLLSATPIHLRNRDLFSQLSLLDPITFDRLAAFEEILDANRPLIQAREAILRTNPNKSEISTALTAAKTHPLLTNNRQVQVIIDELGRADEVLSRSQRASIAYRLDQANLLGHVINRTRRRDVQELRVVRKVGEHIIPFDPVERRFYDAITAAIAAYAATKDINERFLMAMPQRMMSSCMAATLDHWLKKHPIDLEDVDPDEELDDDESDTSPNQRKIIQPLISRLAKVGRETSTVGELEAHDTKYAELLSILQHPDKMLSDEKVIIFSTFKPTLHYLGRKLKQAGISVEILHGTIDDDRDEVLARFADPRGARVLLSSELGSEGIDLQFARALINYDLPWNPMRVEQRIGRIDRLGQRAAAVTILSILHEDTIDSRIYERLYQRLELCKHALGDFEAVLGTHVRELTRDLLGGHLTAAQQEVRIDQTAQALENLKKVQEALEDEAAGLIAYGDYILRTVKAAHELNRWIRGDDIHRYVRDCLNQHYPGCTVERAAIDSDNYMVSLSPAARSDLSDFIRRRRLAQDTRLARDSTAVSCRFTPTLVRNAKERIELISQLHPLTRFVADKVQHSDVLKLRPAVAAKLNRAKISEPAPPPGIYGLAVMRWSLGGVSEIEKLAFGCIRLDDQTILENDDSEKIAITTASYGEPWPEARAEIDCKEVAKLCEQKLILGRLHTGFTEFLDARKAENEDRASVQLATLDRHRRLQTEKLKEISEGHKKAGRQSLVRATEGRITALNDRSEQRKSEIERLRQLMPNTEDIAVLVVKVA